MSQLDRVTGLVGYSGMKVPVRVATTAAITLSGAQTIDGVAVVTDDRVLVKDQASGIANGIYVCDTGTWNRSSDCDGPYDLVSGSLVPVGPSGTANGGKVYQLTTTGTITIDTTSLTFTQALFSSLTGATFLQAGTGAVSRGAQDKMREVITSEDFNNTRGLSNVGVGAGALDSMAANGNYNTAVGVNALTSNSTGDVNTAVGESALVSNVGGGYNTAVGEGALASNVSGDDNTAVGVEALFSCTGSTNTAVGQAALRLAQATTNNTGVGEQAGSSISTGNSNTAIGGAALVAVTIGGANVGVGYQVGLLASTGDQNVLLGCRAGGTTTTSSNVICIGYEAYATSATTSNEATIGNASITRTRLRGIIDALTGQIAFPATANPSSDANTLDDYEEGTWTPSDQSGAALTFTSPAGDYEKIGRQVTMRGSLTYPVTADGSNATIGGFPFTVANTEPARQAFVTSSSETTVRYFLPTASATTGTVRAAAAAAITNVTMSTDNFYFTVCSHI